MIRRRPEAMAHYARLTHIDERPALWQPMTGDMHAADSEISKRYYANRSVGPLRLSAMYQPAEVYADPATFIYGVRMETLRLACEVAGRPDKSSSVSLPFYLTRRSNYNLFAVDRLTYHDVSEKDLSLTMLIYFQLTKHHGFSRG